MRPIHMAALDKTRPALVLTRETAIGSMRRLTVAPITSRIRGLSTEVPVGRRHGLEQDSVINCDDLGTIDIANLGRLIGFLHDEDEPALAQALINAFDLQVEELP